MVWHEAMWLMEEKCFTISKMGEFAYLFRATLNHERRCFSNEELMNPFSCNLTFTKNKFC